FVASYLSGGILAGAILSFRKSKQKARPGRLTDSLWRVGTIALAAAFAGFCLWGIATRMFLEPPIQFTLSRDCEATPIPWSKQKMKFPAGTQVVITQIDKRYTIETSQGRARITDQDLDTLQLRSNQTLPDRFPLPAPAKNAIKYVCFAPALILGVLLLVNF